MECYILFKKYNYDVIILFNMDGNIMNVNFVVVKMIGCFVLDMIGISISRFIGVVNLGMILCSNYELVEKEINVVCYMDGSEIEVLVIFVLIIINKINVGFYLIVKDIME